MDIINIRFCTQQGITILDSTILKNLMKEDLEVLMNERFRLHIQKMNQFRALLQPKLIGGRQKRRRNRCPQDKYRLIFIMNQ